MKLNKFKEQRECLHVYNKLNYTGCFCNNSDFFSKKTFFFFSNFGALIDYFLLETNSFFFYLLKYLGLNIKHLVKYLHKYIRFIVLFMFQKIFTILIKIIFFIDSFFVKLYSKHFNLMAIKNDLLHITYNILSIYKYPIILFQLLSKYVNHINDSKNLLKITKNLHYNSYKIIILKKTIKLQYKISYFYNNLLWFLGKATSKIYLRKYLDRSLNRFRNNIVENLFNICNQTILKCELINTINLQFFYIHI
jgi:hypothetical protein